MTAASTATTRTSRRRPGLTGARFGARLGSRWGDRPPGAGSAGATRPGRGGIGPLRREGRLSGSQSADAGRATAGTSGLTERLAMWPVARRPGPAAGPPAPRGWVRASGPAARVPAVSRRGAARRRRPAASPPCGARRGVRRPRRRSGRAAVRRSRARHRGCRRGSGGCVRGRRGLPRRPASADPPPVSTFSSSSVSPAAPCRCAIRSSRGAARTTRDDPRYGGRGAPRCGRAGRGPPCRGQPDSGPS